MIWAAWGHIALGSAAALYGTQILTKLWPRLAPTLRQALMRWSACWGAVLIGLSLLFLILSHVNYEFEVLNVWNHNEPDQPLLYRIIAAWGNHEGSLLLWINCLAGYGALMAINRQALPAKLHCRMLGWHALITLLFLIFMLMTSNPFALHSDFLREPGMGLNPLLQDISLAFHPPILYTGILGFAVPFVMTLSYLQGDVPSMQLGPMMRPWVLWAWGMLTAGIAWGAAWAYYELGWGGWWFWDPVENASLLPWIVATALIHALLIDSPLKSPRRLVYLSLVTFILCVMGTFLVRSGLLKSVHSFAYDPRRGMFIFALMMALCFVSLTLYLRHFYQVKRVQQTLAPRAFVLNISVTVFQVIAGIIVLGTLYPPLMDLLHQGDVSVEASFYHKAVVPLMLASVCVMIFAPFLPLTKTSLKAILQKLAIPLAPIFVTLLLATYWGLGRPMSGASFIGIVLAVGLVTSGLRYAYLKEGQSMTMILAHVGLGLALFGMSMSMQAEDHFVTLRPGEHVTVHGTKWTFFALQQHEGPTYDAYEAVLVSDDRALRPQLRRYKRRDTLTHESALERHWYGDYYAILGSPLGNLEDHTREGHRWQFRIHFYPMVSWIWYGAAIMAFAAIRASRLRKIPTQA